MDGDRTDSSEATHHCHANSGSHRTAQEGVGGRIQTSFPLTNPLLSAGGFSVKTEQLLHSVVDLKTGKNTTSILICVVVLIVVTVLRIVRFGFSLIRDWSANDKTVP